MVSVRLSVNHIHQKDNFKEKSYRVKFMIFILSARKRLFYATIAECFNQIQSVLIPW